MLRQTNNIQLARWLKLSLFLILSLGLWQLGVQPASAATWTVCQSGGCNFNDIQTAVNSSTVQDGDTLSFITNRETFGDFTLNNKALTFQGFNTEINANGLSVAIVINGNKSVSFNNFTILNGNGINGGGIQLNGGNLTLTDVTITNSDASDSGGGLYVNNASSNVMLTDVTITNNTAVSGGGIYNNGALTTDNLTLTDNDAIDGGGLYNVGTATLDMNTAVQRNDATSEGGGIFNATGATVNLLNSDVSNNTATDGAGVYNTGTLQVTNSNLGSSNEAAQAGGGLYNSASGQATLTNGAVVQNDGLTGAGIYNAGTLTASNSTLSRNEGLNNQPSPNGPGLYNMSGTATLNNVTIHLTNGTSIFANGGTVNVGNTIISSVSGQSACGGGGTLNSNGYNLASDQSCSFLTATGDLQGIDPDLNGITSPTDAYHTPKLSSPVIDAGNPAIPGSSSTACVASDQRNLARPQSRQCDIGAVEIVVYRVYLPAVIK